MNRLRREGQADNAPDPLCDQLREDLLRVGVPKASRNRDAHARSLREGGGLRACRAHERGASDVLKPAAYLVQQLRRHGSATTNVGKKRREVVEGLDCSMASEEDRGRHGLTQ